MSDDIQGNETRDPNKPYLRPHKFDGIQEYDQRLPRWWLITLYGAMLFSVYYWTVRHHAELAPTNAERVTQDIRDIETTRLENAPELDNPTLWAMSRNADFVSPGEEIFLANCALCHRENLAGYDEGGLGPNLADSEWLYGGDPLDLIRILNEGSPDTTSGMVSFESTLGPRRISQVVSFLLSHHEEGAPFEVVPPS